MPIICDPHNFDKAANFLQCLTELTSYFGKLGMLMPCGIDLEPPAANSKAFSVQNAKTFGLYTNYPGEGPRVMVNVSLSRVPHKVPVRVWTLTGYKTDLTAAGILAHEFGHYFDDEKGGICDRGTKTYATMFKLWQEEGCVSSYCPIVREWFAETFRVWFLNPNLLEVAKPKTAQFMLDIGLPKSHDLTWEEVFAHAHPKWIAATKNFIKNGTKQNRPKARKKKKS